MSSRPPTDPRQEAAALVADVRRWLEREEAAGLGDLVATSALRARRSAEPTSVEALPTASSPEPISSSVSTPSLSSVETDLFGQPLPAAPRIETRPADVPVQTEVVESPFDDDLDPGGLAARAEIERDSASLLQTIATEVRACRLCGLCDTRTQAVPGVGSAQSGIVFVGEAPGADEDRRGEPFVGRAGELLTRIIKAMDDARLIPGVPLTRDTVFICNVLKCRPPENRNPLPHEIESCAPYLRRQLAALRPRVICCLGKFAAELLVGVKGTIGGLRGKVYRYQGAKLIVTYHPAACLRNPAYKRPVWEDMQLLAREYLTD